MIIEAEKESVYTFLLKLKLQIYNYNGTKSHEDKLRSSSEVIMEVKKQNKKNSVACSLQANYTDRATAACQRS
jgi:hypothetical protein